MQRSLVIGYGNVDRGDDGAAFHVVNRVRARLGQRVLTEDESGLDSLGAATAVFVPQLTPELAYDAAACHCLVLVDAHVGRNPGRWSLCACSRCISNPSSATCCRPRRFSG